MRRTKFCIEWIALIYQYFFRFWIIWSLVSVRILFWLCVDKPFLCCWWYGWRQRMQDMQCDPKTKTKFHKSNWSNYVWFECMNTDSDVSFNWDGEYDHSFWNWKYVRCTEKITQHRDPLFSRGQRSECYLIMLLRPTGCPQNKRFIPTKWDFSLNIYIHIEHISL